MPNFSLLFWYFQSAALREFDFLHIEDRDVSRSGPLILTPRYSGSGETTPTSQPEILVPPSPQPLVEFPDDDVAEVVGWCFNFFSINNALFCSRCSILETWLDVPLLEN